MTPKTLEVLHVMACNLNVITCNYMHYMSLHAIEDANGDPCAGVGDGGGIAGPTRSGGRDTFPDPTRG